MQIISGTVFVGGHGIINFILRDRLPEIKFLF